MNIKNNIKVEKIDDFGRGIGYVDNKIIFNNILLPPYFDSIVTLFT